MESRQPDPVPVTVDVSGILPGAGQLHTSAQIFAPSGPATDVPTIVFAFPGGGYSRSYFHMDIPGHPGYSMAEYLAGRGYLVVACDNLAAGDSSRPRPAASLTWEALVDANQATVAGVLDVLRREGLLRGAWAPDDRAPDGCRLIGLGHSLGAGLVTVQQARHGTFHALAVLGRAIMGTHIPAPPDGGGTEPVWRAGSLQRDEFEATSVLIDGYRFQDRRTAWQRYLFYWPDVPETVIAADEAVATTFPLEAARALAARDGPNAQAAAEVDVPILLGFGERDVVQDPRLEVTAYRSATDIRFVVQRRSGHCHNLASSRRWLWDRLTGWARGLPRPGT